MHARTVEVPASGDSAHVQHQAAALIERWAPGFIQAFSPEHPERDRPLAIDFDGDFSATNNWAALRPAHGSATPTVYASAILTSTHAYLTYTLFYPRDWFSPVCVPYICHDNDLEVAQLVVARGDEPERDELVMIETKAHFDYVALPAREIALDADGRPWIRVESRGHGMYPLRRGESVAGEQTRYFLAPAAADAPAADRPSERYAIADLRKTLWARRDTRAANGTLWTPGDGGFLAYAGARYGRSGLPLGASMATREYVGGVRPPWGLHAPAGERGDWFLDPAFVAVERHRAWLRPASASLTYVFNPFIADLVAECTGQGCPVTPQPSSVRPTAARLGGGALAAVGLLLWRARRRGLSAVRRSAQRSPER